MANTLFDTRQFPFSERHIRAETVRRLIAAAAEGKGEDQRDLNVRDLLAAPLRRARDDSRDWENLRAKPSWSLAFASFLFNGFLIADEDCEIAMGILKSFPIPLPLEDRILETEDRLVRCFGQGTSQSPAAVIHAASLWDGNYRPILPFLFWEMMNILQKEHAAARAVHHKERGLRNSRAKKRSLVTRAEAITWVLADELWPHDFGNENALRKSLHDLIEDKLKNSELTAPRNVVAPGEETLGDMLARGAATWGVQISDGQKGPKR